MTRPNMRTLQMQDTIDRQSAEIDSLRQQLAAAREMIEELKAIAWDRDEIAEGTIEKMRQALASDGGKGET